MEIIKKYIWYIVAAGILLLWIRGCADSAADAVIGQSSLLENHYRDRARELGEAKIYTQKTVDLLNKDNAEKDREIYFLSKKNLELDKKIADLGIKKKKSVAEAKNFTYKESAEFISKAYNSPKSVTYTNKGVNLADSIPNKVVETLIENDYLGEALSYTELKLANTEEELSLTSAKVENKDKEIKSVVELSDKKDTVITAAEDLNKEYKKQNKKLRTLGTIDKILIVLSFGVGYFITK